MTRKLNPGQRSRFVEAATAVCADGGEAAFRAKLATIARQRPAPDPKPPAQPARKPRKAKP